MPALSKELELQQNYRNTTKTKHPVSISPFNSWSTISSRPSVQTHWLILEQIEKKEKIALLECLEGVLMLDASIEVSTVGRDGTSSQVVP